MTRIGLVRHGETDWNRVHRVQGRTDIPLNEVGRAQVRRTASALLAQPWRAVYSSPLSRALESAQIIAERLGLAPPHVIDGVIERDYGAGEGMTRSELDARYPGHTPVPGRERRSDAAARALATLSDLAAEHPGDELLVVTHGGLIRSVLMAIEPDGGEHHTAPIGNGSVHAIEFQRGEWLLRAFDVELIVPGDEDITAQNAVEERESVLE